MADTTEARSVPTFLDTPAAAAFLGLAPGTLEKWRTRGIGPRFAKLPGRTGGVRYDLRDLTEWLESLKRSSTHDEPRPRRGRPPKAANTS